MAEDERYNGWANRETWALNLWLSNDQGLYEMMNERVREARDSYAPEYDFSPEKLADYMAGDVVLQLWDELTDPDEQLMTAEAILTMTRDVGSEYRVDWTEIGAAFLSGLGDDE